MAKKRAALPKSKAKNAYDLLSDVRQLILAEPLRYDQTSYIARRGGVGEALDLEEYGFKRPACDTVGCVAGWVATLKRGRSFGYAETYEVAASVLGLNGAQAPELFGTAGVGDSRRQTVAHAKAGAAHIRRFQKQYARQLKAKAV